MKHRRRRGARRVLPWLVAAAVAGALVAQTERSLDRIAASKRLRVVKALSAEMERRGQTPPELVARNLQVLREAKRLDPSSVGVPVALAGQYMLLGRYQAAAAVYREALELEARPEVYLNLGNALLASGRRDEARAAFDKAVRLAPRLERLVPPEMR